MCTECQTKLVLYNDKWHNNSGSTRTGNYSIAMISLHIILKSLSTLSIYSIIHQNEYDNNIWVQSVFSIQYNFDTLNHTNQSHRETLVHCKFRGKNCRFSYYKIFFGGNVKREQFCLYTKSRISELFIKSHCVGL